MSVVAESCQQFQHSYITKTRMWADAQRDGRPAEYRWRKRAKVPYFHYLSHAAEVWLMHTARVSCSNAANIGERKTWMQCECCTWQNSVRAAKNIYIIQHGTKWQNIMQSLVDLSVDRCQCSNKAKMQNPWKFAGVPQTCQPISAISGLKFTIL